MTQQSHFQSREDMHALFAQRGEIAMDACEGVGSLLTAETAGNLLLDFDHP